MPGLYDYRTPDLLGPTYQALGNLVPNALNSYQQGSKIALEGARRNALGELAASGQQVDPRMLGQKLLGLGDLEGALGAIRLGELQDDRNLNRQKLTFEMDQARQKLAGQQQIAGLLSGGAAFGGQQQASAPQARGMDGKPNEISSRFLNTVKANGVTNPYALAAIGATGQHETQWQASAVGGTWSDPSEKGVAGTSGGLLSWRNERLDNLRNYARQKGEQGLGSPETQAEFLVREDPNLIAQLNAARSPQEAMTLMNNAWRFKGYDRPGGERDRRLGTVNSWMGQVAVGPQSGDDMRVARAAPQQQMAGGVPSYMRGTDPNVLRQEADQLQASNPEAARQMRAMADQMGQPQAPQGGQNFTPRPGMSPMGVPVTQASFGAQPASIPPQQPQAQLAQAPQPRQQPNALPPGDPAPHLSNEQLNAIMGHPQATEGQRADARFVLEKRFQYQQTQSNRQETWDREDRVNARQQEAEQRRVQMQIDAENRRRQAEFDAEQRRRDYEANKPSERAKLATEAGYIKGTPEWRDFITGENKVKSPEEQIIEREKAADRLKLQGDDRKAYLANGKIPTASEKAMTEGQSNAAMYADRMDNAHKVLSAPDALKVMQSPAQKNAERMAGGGIFGQAAPYLMSNEGQKVHQAKLDFMTAVLRKESGAAIGKDEYIREDLKYFPQPGEGADVIEQKRIARETAIAGLKRAAGPTYTKEQAAKAAPASGQTFKTESGISWSVKP